MQVSLSAYKRIGLLNLYAHFACAKLPVSYLNEIQTRWAGSNFTQFLHKTVFTKVLSFITKWKGALRKF